MHPDDVSAFIVRLWWFWLAFATLAAVMALALHMHLRDYERSWKRAGGTEHVPKPRYLDAWIYGYIFFFLFGGLALMALIVAGILAAAGKG